MIVIFYPSAWAGQKTPVDIPQYSQQRSVGYCLLFLFEMLGKRKFNHLKITMYVYSRSKPAWDRSQINPTCTHSFYYYNSALGNNKDIQQSNS